MTYKTTAHCPVCNAVFDTIQHPHPKLDGQTAAMLLGQCRSDHARESPFCATEAIDDYRGLLRRYIRHVFESEGSNFTDHDLDNTAVSFTPAEIAELRRLAAEGDKEAERIRDERVEQERDDEAKSVRECCEDLGHPYEGP